MILLGLTGSIGMGKSTVAKQFETLGVAVNHADDIVHQLLLEDVSVKTKIHKAFPKVWENGVINRKNLGEVVFGDDEALKLLEAILHPKVREYEKCFVEQAHAKNKKLVVLDIPLLYETHAEDRFNYVVVVSASYDVQRKRVLAREGMTEEKFLYILKKQMPDAKKCEKADFIIKTDQGFAHSLEQVKKITEKLTYA